MRNNNNSIAHTLRCSLTSLARGSINFTQQFRRFYMRLFSLSLSNLHYPRDDHPWYILYVYLSSICTYISHLFACVTLMHMHVQPYVGHYTWSLMARYFVYALVRHVSAWFSELAVDWWRMLSILMMYITIALRCDYSHCLLDSSTHVSYLSMMYLILITIPNERC